MSRFSQFHSHVVRVLLFCVNSGSTFVWLSGMFSAFRCNYYWFATGRSSPARVAAFPGLSPATRRIPFGRPVSSSRTLTTGLWTEGPKPTAVCWEDAGRWLPVPGNSNGWQGEFTHVILLTLSARSMRFVPTAFRPSDVARGLVWDPLIPGRDLNSMLPADTWSTGVCVPKTHPTSRERTLPYALSYNTRLPQAHDLSLTLLWL